MQPTPQRMRVLIVDDDAALLGAVERAFREADQDVVACGTFAEGRRALREQHFDALITDVRLGAFNGLQLAVIAHSEHPEMRLIVFSGFDDPVLRAEAERVNATYMAKPVHMADLLRVLRTEP